VQVEWRCPCVGAEANGFSAADADAQSFMCRINQNHPGNFLRISGNKISDHRPAVRVPDEDKWAALSEFGKGIVQFEINLRKSARFGAGIAPGISRAIVGADASEMSDTLLNENPIYREISQAIFDHHSGTAIAGTVHVQTETAEVDKLSGWF
jgi:hypothetical protein